jgi:hypothetical protein
MAGKVPTFNGARPARGGDTMGAMGGPWKNAATQRRVLRGAIWGLVASGVVTAIMIVDLLLTRTAGPRTFPILVLGRLLGQGHGLGLDVLGLGAQLAYGSLMGLVFAFLARPMTVAKGVGVGLMLWLILQIEFVPWLGWGDFGFEHGGASLAYTFTLHLIYGVTLGWLGWHDETAHAAHFDDLGRLIA